MRPPKKVLIGKFNGLDAEAWLINESGLYAPIPGSHKSEARRFKHWVTSEVLLSLRKAGTYGLDLVVQFTTCPAPTCLAVMALTPKEHREYIIVEGVRLNTPQLTRDKGS